MIALTWGWQYLCSPDPSKYFNIEKDEGEHRDETGEEQSEPVDIEPEIFKTIYFISKGCQNKEYLFLYILFKQIFVYAAINTKHLFRQLHWTDV